MTPEQITEIARQAGMEIHPRKMQIRVGADAALGLDSTEVVMRFAQKLCNAALEEAAVKCDGEADNWFASIAGQDACKDCAKEIRSLKS